MNIPSDCKGQDHPNSGYHPMETATTATATETTSECDHPAESFDNCQSSENYEPPPPYLPHEKPVVIQQPVSGVNPYLQQPGTHVITIPTDQTHVVQVVS